MRSVGSCGEGIRGTGNIYLKMLQRFLIDFLDKMQSPEYDL